MMPALAPRIPDAGRRAALEALPVSADALALAQLATHCARERRMLAIIAAAFYFGFIIMAISRR